jgi:hypothetical protein
MPLIPYAGADRTARPPTTKFAMRFWTDEKVAELQRLWCSTRMTALEIGAALGCGRNAVIGKAHRLGLEKRRETASRRGEARLAKSVEEKKRRAAQATAAWRTRRTKAPQETSVPQSRKERPQTKFVTGQEPHLAPPAGGLGVSLADLTDNGCRYLWDGGEGVLYCGKPAVKGWCAEHGLRMTQELRRR